MRERVVDPLEERQDEVWNQGKFKNTSLNLGKEEEPGMRFENLKKEKLLTSALTNILSLFFRQLELIKSAICEIQATDPIPFDTNATKIFCIAKLTMTLNNNGVGIPNFIR